MAKKSGQVQETAQERALADVGKQQLQDFKTRWLPVQQQFAAGVAKSGEAGSYERGRATTMAGVDTSVQFGQVGDKLDAGAAARGAFGSAGHKLAITGLAEDRATSGGLAAVAADQGVSDQYTSGLGAVMALGRGEKATAIQGLGVQARVSGMQAQADANQAMADRAGQYQLAGTAVGIGAGLWSGSKLPDDTWDYRGTTLPDELRGGR